MSAFFRDDPELFAPRVISNGTLAHRSADASRSTLSHSHPGGGEAAGFYASDSWKVTPTLGSTTPNLNNRHIPPSADDRYKSARPDPVSEAKMASFSLLASRLPLRYCHLNPR